MLARLRSNTFTHAVSLEAAETEGGHRSPSDNAEDLIVATRSDCPDSRLATTPTTAAPPPHPAAPFQPLPTAMPVVAASSGMLADMPASITPPPCQHIRLRARAHTPHTSRTTANARLALNQQHSDCAPCRPHGVHTAAGPPSHAGPVPCRASAMPGQCHAYCGRSTELGRARTPIGTACARITDACKAQLCYARGSTAPASAAVASGADFARGGGASDDAAGDGGEHRDCAARGAGCA